VVYISIEMLKMIIVRFNVLDSTTHIPSPLMGEDKGEGDNWGGRSWATGLPETWHCEGFSLCHCEERSDEAISLSNFPLP